MSDLTLQIDGLDNVLAKIQDLLTAVPQAGQDALRAEAEIEMTEAKRRTPVLTGALRASGVVQPVEGQLAVTLTFGGPAAAYAIWVHENMEAFHRTGQAKFLESTLLESAPYIAQRIATRIAQRLGTGS